MTFPANPAEREPKGDRNRRIALALDVDQFASEAGVTTEQLRQYEMTLPDEGGFDLGVASKVGAALERLEANPPATQRVVNSNTTRATGIGQEPANSEDGILFYTSENGDIWLKVTDVGGRKFVRHVPNSASGGSVELVDLQSFRDREPHSPQNQALEALLRDDVV